MTQITITLPPELARYVADAVVAGDWASTDEFMAHAVSLARTAAMLGGTPPAPAAPTPPVPAPPAANKTPSGGVPVVDLTRQSFDSSSFMGELTRKLHGDKK